MRYSEKATKGEVLVDIAHYSGELRAYRNIVNLICEKKDEVENNSETYVALNHILNQVSEDYNEVSVLEVRAKYNLNEILEQEKNALSQADQSEDNA